jgi:hypothetical protein
MTDLIALGHSSEAAILLVCGHAQAVPPEAMSYYRWLFTSGTKAICMSCDDLRLIFDLITRHD